MRSSSHVRATKLDEEEGALESCARLWCQGEIPEGEMPPPTVNWRHSSCYSTTVSMSCQCRRNRVAVSIPLFGLGAS